MKPTEKRGRGGKRSLARDIISVILIVVPFLGAAILNVLTKPASDGIDVTGAQVYFTVKMPIQDLYITEAQVTSFCVMSALLGLCLFLTNGLSTTGTSKRQLAAELIVTKVQSFVNGNMGERFAGFAPFGRRNHGAVGIFKPFKPSRALSGDLRSQHSRRLGYSGFHTYNPLQAKGRDRTLSEGFCRAYPDICPLQCHRRDRNTGVDGVPSLRKRAFRRCHIYSCCRGAERTFLSSSRMASGGSRKVPASQDRASRNTLTLFRPFQRMSAGIHIRHADYALHIKRLP